MNRIQQTFHNARHRKVMSLFLTAGFPTLDATADLVLGLEAAGADLVELGMPFSDPLADGPTIQQSSTVAIANGVTIPLILDMVRKIRESSQIPLVLMGYLNPVVRYGIEAFCRDAAEAGADALILPDLPVDEQDLVAEPARWHGLAMIHLVAPNTDDERMRQVDELSGGFVYCVSVTGVTGARDGGDVSVSVNAFIDRVNLNVTKNPVLVGFGIQSKADAEQISAKARGFIVGSALIHTIQTHFPNSDWKDRVYEFVRNLR